MVAIGNLNHHESLRASSGQRRAETSKADTVTMGGSISRLPDTGVADGFVSAESLNVRAAHVEFDTYPIWLAVSTPPDMRVRTGWFTKRMPLPKSPTAAPQRGLDGASPA